jgi:hypothetical protein
MCAHRFKRATLSLARQFLGRQHLNDSSLAVHVLPPRGARLPAWCHSPGCGVVPWLWCFALGVHRGSSFGCGFRSAVGSAAVRAVVLVARVVSAVVRLAVAAGRRASAAGSVAVLVGRGALNIRSASSTDARFRIGVVLPHPATPVLKPASLSAWPSRTGVEQCRGSDAGSRSGVAVHLPLR